MREGKNFGTITLETTYQTFHIPVTATKPAAKPRKRRDQTLFQLEKTYIDFRLNLIPCSEYVHNIQTLIQRKEESNQQEFWNVMRAHAALLTNKEDVVNDYIENHKTLEKPYALSNMEDILLESFYY